NPHAPTHERCGIRDARHGADVGAQFKIVQIDTTEDDAFACWSGKNSDCRIPACMKSDAGEFNWSGDRLLVHKPSSVQFGRLISMHAGLRAYKPNAARNRVHLCTTVARKKQKRTHRC